MKQILERKNEKRENICFVLSITALFFLRYILSSRLPAYIITNLPHDDLWMVKRASYLLQGQWMGPYDHYTLIKGVFSPILLAFAVILGIGFQKLNTVLYCFACLVFVMALKETIKKRWMRLSVFAILLFNPITYALQTGQRVYRNGIGQWQILLIFAAILAMFIRRNEPIRKLLPWALLGGMALGAFFNTREDGIWIYPFVLVAIIVTVLLAWKEKHLTYKKTAVFVLPIAVALMVNLTVCTVNCCYYGEFLRNDRDGGNYAKVMKDLYLIEPNAEEDALYQSKEYEALYYNVYTSTVEKAFEASPTFKTVAQPIRNAIAMWDGGEALVDGQPNYDHILFAIREGIYDAGYYISLPETEDFYAKVHEELQDAFENGTLKKRGVSISAMSAPVQEGDIAKTLSLLPKTVLSIIKFEGVSSEVVPATGNAAEIEQFRLMAGSDYLVSSPNAFVCSGWAFAYDNDLKLKAFVCDAEGNVLLSVPFVSGKDVSDYFVSMGLNYANAINCRFSFTLEGYDLSSGIKLRFTSQDGAVYRELPLDGSATGGSDGEFQYAIDKLDIEQPNQSPQMFFSHFAGRANFVTKIYQSLGGALAVLSLLAYLGLSVILIMKLRRKALPNVFPVWLSLTAIALSFLVFVLCMCYMTATTFFAGVYLYLGSAYVLFLMFSALAIFGFFNIILDFCKENNLRRTSK